MMHLKVRPGVTPIDVIGVPTRSSEEGLQLHRGSDLAADM